MEFLTKVIIHFKKILVIYIIICNSYQISNNNNNETISLYINHYYNRT